MHAASADTQTCDAENHEFGANGSRIFCKEDEPDPPPEPGSIVVDKLAEYHERIRKAAESGDAEAAKAWDLIQLTRKRAESLKRNRRN